VFTVAEHLKFVPGNGYITTAVLKEILRELDDTLTNDDLDAMIEGNNLSRRRRFSDSTERLMTIFRN
jgi:Ca2+-binding EF-hand superfamily protein